MRLKFKAFIISAFWTILPCILAGGMVGAFFVASFWYWAIGITVLSFFYVGLDRVPVRLFGGAMRGLSLWTLLKYGYASTEKRPIITNEMIREENDWRTTTYNHFYGNDR